MKSKIFMAFMLGLIGMCALTGCGFSSHKESNSEKEPKFEELDINYTTNDDGTYTYKDNIYKYKIEVSGNEGESPNTFSILTNNKETTFKDISSNMKKADVSTGIPKFVILGWTSVSDTN